MKKPLTTRLDEIGVKVPGDISPRFLELREEFDRNVDQVLGDTLRETIRKSHGGLNWSVSALRFAVRLTGLSDFSEFPPQVSRNPEHGPPDLVLNSPGGPQVLVELKAPTQPLLDDDKELVHRELPEYERFVHKWVKVFSSPSYWQQVRSSSELPVIFIDSDHLLKLLSEKTPKL